MSWLFLILVFLTIHPISLRWFQVHPQSQVQISHFPYSKSSWFPFSNLDTSPHSLFSYHLPSYHLVQQCQWWFTLFHFYLQLSHWVSLPQLNDHIEYSSVFQCTLGGMLIPAACSLQFVSRIDDNPPALERCHIFIYIPLCHLLALTDYVTYSFTFLFTHPTKRRLCWPANIILTIVCSESLLLCCRKR